MVEGRIVLGSSALSLSLLAMVASEGVVESQLFANYRGRKAKKRDGVLQGRTAQLVNMSGCSF